LRVAALQHGVLFRSYRDGSRVALTPESSVLAQKQGRKSMLSTFQLNLSPLLSLTPPSVSHKK
jgi:queuine/archaeosine tRNA-ribosyltransferase